MKIFLFGEPERGGGVNKFGGALDLFVSLRRKVSPALCRIAMNTSRLAIIFLLGLLLASACGCGRSRLHAELDLADSLAEHAGPDTAARVLLELKPLMADAPDDVAMRWRLLMVKAADKAYITHTSDSLLRPALDYYNHRTSDTLRPEAFYYAGRVYSDMGDYPRALDYFGRALAAMPPGRNPVRQSIIHDQMRSIYGSQFLYSKELEHARASLDIAMQTNDTAGIIQGWSIVGGALLSLHEPDSAAVCYRNAWRVAEAFGDPHRCDKLRLQLINFFYETGRYASADSILRHHFPTRIYHNEKYSKIAILASYYLDIEQWDSCMYYANLAIASDRPYSRMFGHADMAKSYLGLNRPELALPHMKIYHHMLDSLRREENQALSLRVEAAYDYSLRERDNIELQAAAERLHRTIFALIALAVGLFGVGLGIYYRQRSRVYRMELEKLRLEKIMEELEAENRKLGLESSDLRSEIKSLMEACTDRGLSATDANTRIKMLLDPSRFEKMTATDWSSLEEALDVILPGFCSQLHALGLSEREYRVSILARLGLGNKSISVFIGGSSYGVGMVRIRLSRKHGKGDRSADWDEFLKTL